MGIILESIGNKQYLKDLKNDLDLCFSVEGEVIAGVIQYNPDLFKRETVELFGEHYLKVLCTLLDFPDLEISKFELLSADKKRQCLFEFNNASRDYPKHKTIQQLLRNRSRKRRPIWR